MYQGGSISGSKGVRVHLDPGNDWSLTFLDSEKGWESQNGEI